MSESNNPEQGIGLMEAADQFAALLAPKEDNQTPQTEVQATEDAEADEAEALQADDESEETPLDAASEDDADEEGADDLEAAADDEDEPDTEEEGTKLVTVKIDGKEEQVPLDEVVAGYQRQADYTRKSQALAEERKSFQSEAEQVMQERQQYAQLLGALSEQLRTMQTQEPDWEKLYNDDPLEYVRQKDEWRDRQEKLQAVSMEQQRLYQMQQEQQAQQIKQLVEENRRQMLEKMPRWQDRAKWDSDRAALREYGQNVLGFSEEELDQAVDHRGVVAVYKAMKYDQMMAKRPQKEQPKGPKVAKAGVATNKPATRSQMTRAKQRLAKTGRIEDAQEVFLGLI